MDRETLIGIVEHKHHIRVDPNDPVFVLATISEVMLQEARGELQRIVADAISQAATANTQATERAAEQIRQAGETAAARIQQEAAISARRFRRATLVAVVCSLTALAASVSTIVRLVAG